MSFNGSKKMNSHARTEQAIATASGNYIYQSQANEYRPVFKGGPLVFRVFPYWDQEENAWEPMNITMNNGYKMMGNWSFEGLVAAFTGQDMKVSFFLQDSIDGDFNLMDSPYYVLYKAVVATKDWPSQERYWVDKLEGGTNAGPELPDPRKPIWFMRGFVYEKDGEIYTPKAEEPAIIRLSASTGEALRRAINAELVQDPNFDIAALDQSNVVTVWNSSRPHPYTHQPGFSRFPGYDVCITHELVGASQGLPVKATDQEAVLRNSLTPWGSVFRFLAYQEQADLLCKAFASTPEMLLYAFADHPDWIAPEIRNKAVKTKAAVQVHPSVVAPTELPDITPAEVPSVPFDSAPASDDPAWSHLE